MEIKFTIIKNNESLIECTCGMGNCKFLLKLQQTELSGFLVNNIKINICMEIGYITN